MHNLESLKRRIENAQDLESVVKTMKTLAAVSIRQYEAAVESLKEYDATVEAGMGMLLRQLHSPPQGGRSSGGRTGAVVFGSDQGMCGQFNEHVVNYFLDLARADNEAPNWSVMTVGSRISGRIADAGFDLHAEFSVAGSATGIVPVVQDLLRSIEVWRSQLRLGRILLIYNRRQSASSSQPHHEQLLPLDPGRWKRMTRTSAHSRTFPLVTMDPDVLFSRLVRQYFFVMLFRACAESLAGENASRIASMQAAARSIEERIAELTVEYNQLRQTAITEEILDIVTGAEAGRERAGK